VLEPLESRCLLSTITEYPVPPIGTTAANPQAITSAGGKLWFSELGGGIGAISPANPSSGVTSYTNGLPTFAGPNAITTGPDGNVWFADPPVHQIGILNVSNPTANIVNLGSAQGLPTTFLPAGITTGPDGNIWVTDANNDASLHPNGSLVMINPSNPGTISPEIVGVPLTMVGFFGLASQIVSGPNGNLYFTEAKFGTGGVVTASAIGFYNPSTKTWGEIPLKNSNEEPLGISAGPNGTIWFTEVVPVSGGGFQSSAVGVINATATTPTATEISTTTPSNGKTVNPTTITAGPDGQMYFTDTANGSIGVVTVSSTPSSDTITLLPIPTSSTFPSPLPQGITAGPDGNVWFADFNNAVGQVKLDRQLVVTTQPPSNVTALNSFPVSAEVTYAGTTVVDPTYHGIVVLSLTGNGALGGTTSGVASGGVVTFPSVYVTQAGSNDTLTAMASGVNSATTSSFTVNNPPPPPPPTPVISSTSVLYTQPTRKGRPLGKPYLSGYQFNFSVAMNPNTAGNAGDYKVGTYVPVTVRSHGKRIRILQLQSVGISSVTFNPTTPNTVRLTLSGKQTFPHGGQITLLAGINSAAGVSLGSNAVFNVAPTGRTIRQV
jgi:virginiamycin B lyase